MEFYISFSLLLSLLIRNLIVFCFLFREKVSKTENYYRGLRKRQTCYPLRMEMLVFVFIGGDVSIL